MIKHTATFLFPGSFFPEEIVKEIPRPTFQAALSVAPNDERFYGYPWYGVTIRSQPQKRFVAEDGEERVLSDGKAEKIGTWLIGEVFDETAIRNLGRFDGHDYSTLLANMKGNGWPLMCRTRCHNWQPVEDNTTVVDESYQPVVTPA